MKNKWKINENKKMIEKQNEKMKLQMKTQMKNKWKNNFKHFQSVARCESYKYIYMYNNAYIYMNT